MTNWFSAHLICEKHERNSTTMNMKIRENYLIMVCWILQGEARLPRPNVTSDQLVGVSHRVWIFHLWNRGRFHHRHHHREHWAGRPHWVRSYMFRLRVLHGRRSQRMLPWLQQLRECQRSVPFLHWFYRLCTILYTIQFELLAWVIHRLQRMFTMLRFL